MKYYLIAGEASGDLHASRLMEALRDADSEAEFRFVGGDAMARVGGKPQTHYRYLAYMGFGPVLRHLGTILRGMRRCERDIMAWKPDVVVLVDYPSFNLRVARYVRKRSRIPVFYYIAPKVWAWKEWRVRQIRRDVDEVFSILPFEVDFFEGKHRIPVRYVGNPTKDEVAEFLASCQASAAHGTASRMARRVALLPGSRKQEVEGNLPVMLRAVSQFPDVEVCVAGAPGLDAAFYRRLLRNCGLQAEVVFGRTYELLRGASAALVTSGTATLETALLGVPQVVCYHTAMGRLVSWLRRRFLHVPYVSLVNLIANREVVRELVADGMTESRVAEELKRILPPDGVGRQAMLDGYAEVSRRLGDVGASRRAAELMVKSLRIYNKE